MGLKPTVTTNYEDNKAAAIAPGLANIEVKIGGASDGIPGRVYTISGETAKEDARAIFKGGPLLKAIYDAIDAGSTQIYAVRIGTATPATVRSYSGTGSLDTATAALAATIQAGGVYGAELLTDPPLWLMPSTNDDHEIDGDSYAPFSGGSDGSALSNGDYITGLNATRDRKDAAWIHAVGGNTGALWTAILTHCAEMKTTYLAERFAMLETPPFTSSAERGTPQYNADLDDYVDAILAMMATVGDKNAVVLAGGALFLNPDGEEEVHSVVSAVAGTVAGLPIHKSWINKPVKNIIKSNPGEDSLVPAWRPADIERLLAARVNMVHLEEGMGYVITENLTGAAAGSDYGQANELRVSYVAAKAARNAAKPFIGEENDDLGDGLAAMTKAASKPLRNLVKSKNLIDFEVSARSDADDRDLGNAYLRIGLRHVKHFKRIVQTIWMKPQE